MNKGNSDPLMSRHTRLLAMMQSLKGGDEKRDGGPVATVAHRWGALDQMISLGDWDEGQVLRWMLDADSAVTGVADSVRGIAEELAGMEACTEAFLDQVFEDWALLNDEAFVNACMLILDVEAARLRGSGTVPSWISDRVIRALESIPRTPWSGVQGPLGIRVLNSLKPSHRNRLLLRIGDTPPMESIDGRGAVAALFSGDDARATEVAAFHVIEHHDAEGLKGLFKGHPGGPEKQKALKLIVRALARDDRMEEIFDYLPMIESKEVRDDESLSIARRLLGGTIFDEFDENSRLNQPRNEEVTERHVGALLADVAPIPSRFACDVMMLLRYGMPFGGDVDRFQRELLAIEGRMSDFYALKGPDFVQVCGVDWVFIQAPAWLRIAFHFVLLNRWSDSIRALRRVLRTSLSASWIKEFLEREFRRVPLKDRETVIRELVDFLAELDVYDRRKVMTAAVEWIGWYADPSGERFAHGLIQEVYAGDSLSRFTSVVDAFFVGQAQGLSERGEFESVLGISEKITDIELAATALVLAEFLAAEVKKWVWCDKFRARRKQRLSSARVELSPPLGSIPRLMPRGQKSQLGREVAHSDSYAAEDRLIDGMRELDGVPRVVAMAKLDGLAEVALKEVTKLDQNRVLLYVARRLIEGEESEGTYSILSKVLRAIRDREPFWYGRTVEGLRQALGGRGWSPLKDLLEVVVKCPDPDDSSVLSVPSPDFETGREKLFEKISEAYGERIEFKQLLDAVVKISLRKSDLSILERALASIRIKCAPERWRTTIGTVREQMMKAGCTEQALAAFERGFAPGTPCEPLETWIEQYRERVSKSEDHWVEVVQKGSFEEALQLIDTLEFFVQFKLIGILFGRVVGEFGLERLEAIFVRIESLIANRPLDMESLFDESLVNLALECFRQLERVREVNLRLGWVNRIWEWDYGFGKSMRSEFLIAVASALAGCGLVDVALGLIEGLPSVNDRSLGYSTVSVRLGLVNDEPEAVEVFHRFLSEHASIQAWRGAVDSPVKGALYAAWAFADAGRRDDVVRMVRLVETHCFETQAGPKYLGVSQLLSELIHLLDRLGMVDEWLDFMERMLLDVSLSNGAFYLFIARLRNGFKGNHVDWRRFTTGQRLRFMQICWTNQRQVLSSIYERGDIFKSCIDGCEDALAMANCFRAGAPHVVEMVRSMSMGLWPVSFYEKTWSDKVMEDEGILRLIPLLCPYDRDANDAYALLRVRRALERDDWETIRSVDLRCPELGLSWLVSAKG